MPHQRNIKSDPALLAQYDVIVVGGGIHGTGMAQACAAAGYDCLLIEQDDWGRATSSRSSKLLHGGLRYLQTGQLHLVHECLQERERLLRNAPDLARINWFYIPLYHNSRYQPWQLFCGLSLYRLLTGWRNPHSRFRIIPPRQWHEIDGLRTENLRAVFAYQDGQTDDHALTCAVRDSARLLGAHCVAPAELRQATRADDGFRVTITDRGEPQSVRCKVLINAAGPWVNHVIDRCAGSQVLDIDLVQGTHVVLQQAISAECFYLEAPSDGRAVFVLPWQGKTLVGTTETPFNGMPQDTQPLDSEIQYLLDTVRYYFPAADLTLDSQFSGLRVLPASSQRAFLRSRDTRILDDHGLISLYGGKLTAYRATCAKVIPLLQDYLGRRQAKADTRELRLTPAD